MDDASSSSRSSEDDPDLQGTIPPPSPHVILLVGVMFSIIGGFMLIASIGLSWVVEFGSFPVPLDPLQNWYLPDLISMNDWYYLMYLIPLSGITITVFSAISFFTENKSNHRAWTIGVIVTSVLPIIFTSAALVWLYFDFVNVGRMGAVFGPASYVSAFGCVLVIAGGAIQLLDSLRHPRKRGFRKPGPMTFKESRTFGGDKVDRLNVSGDKRCPSCNSPISDNWEICPVCRQEI